MRRIDRENQLVPVLPIVEVVTAQDPFDVKMPPLTAGKLVEIELRNLEVYFAKRDRP